MVALVVTIVVLLILASISIQGITRTGIFSAAEDTKLEHKRALIGTILQTKLKINQTEQIRGTDEEVVRATYEDVKNDLEEIKKAGGKDIEVSEVTSEEKNGKTEWFFEVKVDGDVYKVGLDGSDYLGKEEELSPVIQIKVVKTTTNTIAVTATTRRNEGGKIEYYIKEKGSTNFNLVETTDQNEFTYTKLKQDTTFVVKAVAIGKNGQKKASNEVEAKTSIVPKLDSNDIKFAAKPNTWTKESVEVTATLNVNGQTFSLATSKNTTTDWVTSNRQIFTSNGTMYAALTDGNNYGITASYEVTNIDKEKPEIKSITATTNTIKITATDNASGIKSYAISESNQTPTKFTIVDNTKLLNQIIENVKQSTKYYVWVKDEAGNISNAAEVTTATVPKLTNANTTITKTPSDWTNQSVTAKAETTEKGYSLQTKKDNGEWQNTDIQNYTENGTIYARLWDGTNAGEETYANITNIDKTAPTSTGAEIKNVTAAGYDVYVYGVKDAGSGVNRVQFPTWTEANGQDDIQGSWQTSTAAKGTKQQDGTTWVYHVNITDHKTEAGVYNTHVYAYDNLGNGKYIFGQQITVPKVKVTYDENYIANGETESKKQTVEKIYNTELGTLTTPTRKGYTFAGWFTEASGGTQISGTTKTPESDTTYYAHWTANQLNFANQTITKTFSTGAQTANITAASNGTESYTYTEKTETNASGTATNYITLNGTTITIAANTPAGTYTYVITATDNGSKVTKDATYTIKIERAKTATAAAADKTYNGANQTGVTGSSVTWSGTQTAIDAGTYTATATPDGNHAWSDGTTTAKTITWKINPKQIAVTWGTTTTFTYNGQPQAPTAAATSGVNGETINITRTTGTNAGSYTSTASISSVTGGRTKKENYTLTGTTKAFTINKASVTTPANLAVSTAGIVTWSGATNATSYEISIDNKNWTAAASGVNYLSTIIGATGNRTVYVRAINKDSNNYATPSGNATKTVAVYAVTINSNSTTMGTVDAASYNVISGATYTTNGNKLTIKGITTGTTTSDLKTITATNKTGYSFSKWSATSGTITAATTITATFTANTYTISYNGNGATGGSTASHTVTYDQSAAIAANGFTKTGYSFAGWTTKADGSDDGYNWTNWKGTWKYVNGQYGIANGKLQLYARWTANTYTIAYNGNGATGGNTASHTVTYDQSAAIAANGFTRTGYTFAGWTTKTDGSDDGYNWTNWKGTWKYVNGQYGIANGKLQLYARWTINSYALTVAPNSGNYNGTTSNTTVTRKYKDYYTLMQPTRTGYTFNNWSLSGSGTLMRGIGNGKGTSIGGFTATEKTENGEKYTNYSFSTTATSNTWYNIRFPNYAITAGHSYEISLYMRINSMSNASLELRHACVPNDYNSTGRVSQGIGGTTSGWVKYVLNRTYAGTTIASSNGSSNVTVNPLFEIYTSNLNNAGKTTSMNFDIRDVVIRDTTNNTYKYTTNYIYEYGAGNGTVTASWGANQLNFANQTIAKTFSTGAQTAGITGASNGTGSYTYTEKSEKNAAGTATNYISISGTTINIAANTPAGIYTYVITAADNNSKVTKDATYTITIGKAAATNPTLSNTTLTYNGAAQYVTVSGGYGGTIYYRTSTNNSSWGSWSTTKPSLTDVGTIYVQAYVVGDGNHNNTGATGSVTLKMNPKSVAVTWGTTTTFNYNGNAQAPTAAATSGVSGETINVTRTTATNAGSYTSTASISSVSGGRAKAGNYTLTGTTKAFTINKVSAGNPTLSNTTLTYNGAAQYVTVSGGYGGTIYYRTSTNNSSWGSWTTTKPSLTDVGTIYVQAYVAGDGNHNNTGATGSVTLKMNPKSVAVTWGTTTTFNYNGGAQAPTAAATSGVANETINITRTTATNAGNYTSTASISSVSGGRANKSNYTLSGNTKAFTINKVSAGNPTLSNTTVTYNGASQYVTVSGGYGGTIYYRTSTNNSSWGSWTTTKPSLIDVGTIYVQAYVAGDGNHNSTGATGSVTLKMNPKSVAVTWGTTTTFTYNGNAQAPTAAATSGVANETINVTRTTGTNAGSYTSTASISSVSGGRAKAGNYTLTGTTKAFTINPSSTAIKVYYPTSATAVSSKTVYRNKCSSSSTVLSTTNTGTSNNVLASTYNGLYGSFGGYATAVNTTTRATTAIAGIATRTETTYYVVTTGSNTSSITATFNYYNGSAWTSTTKTGTRTNNYTYYCTSTTVAKTATSYSHGSIAAPSTSTGPYSTSYVGWSTGSKSMSTTSVTTANTTYYAVYRSNVTVKVVTGTAVANVTSKTIYRNAMKDGTFLSESNTGTSNLTTISGAYRYLGLATSANTLTCTAITTCAASTTNTFYTVSKIVSNSTVTVTYKYQNGSNDTTASGQRTDIIYYYLNSSMQVLTKADTTVPYMTMPTPTRTGYTFVGWNTNSTATTAPYKAGASVSMGGSTTLYGIWLINGSIGLSATSGSTCTGKAQTFTINSNPSGGTLSVSSADSTIATVSISGTTVTVTPKKVGSTTITINSAAKGSYTSASTTYTITVGNHSATTGGSLKSAATCTAAAVYYHKCSICGTGLTTTYTSGSALGHNYSTYVKDMGTWSWESSANCYWSAVEADGKKTAMFNNAAQWARFKYTSYGAHTMQIAYFTNSTSASIDLVLGTTTNATASGVTGYRMWGSGVQQLWVGGKLQSTKNVGTSAHGDGTYHTTIVWGHGGSGSWTFTAYSNSNNTGVHPRKCVRYKCTRCSATQDRYQ